MPGSPVADIRTSFGAALVGLLVSTTLFGFTIVQTWMYFWNYRNRDSKALKSFIAFITVLDAFDTILCAYAIYWYLILNFGNIESLDHVMWALNFQIAIGSLVGASVQIYYARRVYIVSQRIICPILIVALVVVASSFAYLFTAKQFALKRFSGFHSLVWIPCAGITAVALADLLIAAAMCWSLHRQRTGFARTDSIIMTLMVYSINSGLLTCLFSTAAIISFVVSPSSTIWLAFLWVMGKCGVNSLLATLNSRDYIRERSSAREPNSAFNPTSIQFEPPGEAYGSKSEHTGVSQAVITSDFARSKYDHNVGPTFETPKPDTSSIPSQGQSRTPVSSALHSQRQSLRPL